MKQQNELIAKGNLLYHNGEIIEVLGIAPHCGDYAITTDKVWVYLKNCKPIPLTEQMLLDCLATTSCNDGELHFDRFRLIWKPSYNFWYVISLDEQTYLTKIEFLHEWQNFVFVMNGQELTYNPK